MKSTLIGTDCWSFKLALVSLTIVAVLDFVCQLPGWVSFILIPLSMPICGTALFAILAIAVYCFMKKRPRRGTSFLLALLLPVLLWRPMNWVADVVHVGLTTGIGAGQLGVSSKSNNGDFVVYDWSVGFAGGPNKFLIHDVTDEIALPMAQHRHPPSSENGFGEECAGRVDRLMTHYYICTF